ncbi:helix-turn-helix domain-containing protein [Pirellulimonas nuda]|uniref:helix-turn-helix domain-containing protein n=1 Tax=Pirellulimonas nuda TaxID=2528009 RepID=UPI0018D37D53|nr:helix-turn-helix domain-containing protein [Pirellulimonas nuda]
MATSMITACEPPRTTSSTVAPIAFEIATGDVDDLSRLYPGWEGRFQQVSAGAFRGNVQVVQGQLIRAFRGTTNQVLLTRGSSQPGWIDFSPITPRNHKSRWQGRQCDPNHLVVRGGQVGVDNVAARDAEIVTLSVPIDLIRRAANSVLRLKGDPARIDWRCLCVEPTALAVLEQLVKRIAARSASDASSSDCYADEQECVVAALNVLSSRNGTCALEPRGNRASLVRRAEEYLRERLASTVGLIDLCEELDVSARTMQYAFRERFGIGPIEYLRMLRLNAVRADLKTARTQGLCVRDVARRWGYRHLSNFAADYKRHFGVLPSKAKSGSLSQ